MNPNQRMRKLRKSKAFVILAHRDMPELTYRNLDLPTMVPLYLNFNFGRPVGRVWLRPNANEVYAMVILDTGINEYGERPQVILGVEGGTTIIEDEVRYVVNAVVTSASIVKESDWKDIYGEIDEPV